MSLAFEAKAYVCEFVEVSAEDGQVVVTFIGNFPADGDVSEDEASSIVNSSLFRDIMRTSFEQAPAGTPVRDAFDKLARDGGEVALRFLNSDAKVAA